MCLDLLLERKRPSLFQMVLFYTHETDLLQGTELQAIDGYIDNCCFLRPGNYGGYIRLS